MIAGDEEGPRRHLPRGLRRRGSRRQGRRLPHQGERGPREGTARSRRRLRPIRFGVRHPRRAPRQRSAVAWRRSSSGVPRLSSATPRSRPHPPTRQSIFRTISSTPAPTSCGSDSSAPSRPAASTRRCTRRCRARTATTLIDEGEESAELTLRREATLAAVAEAEDIEPTDEELIEALGPGEGKEEPAKILEASRRAGGTPYFARRCACERLPS